jgi:hypothetical protein
MLLPSELSAQSYSNPNSINYKTSKVFIEANISFVESSLTAYPNPFSESFSVAITHNKNEIGQLIVYNSLGVIVLESSIELKSNATALMNISFGDKPGMYFVSLVDSQGKTVSSLKIVAQ